jgi:hypothetical protein
MRASSHELDDGRDSWTEVDDLEVQRQLGTLGAVRRARQLRQVAEDEEVRRRRMQASP